MYKARRYLNKVSLKNLYYAYIYPYFTYCIEVWGSAAKCHVNSLFLLQKKIIRIMTFSPYLAHTAPIFIDLAIVATDIHVRPLSSTHTTINPIQRLGS